MGLSAAVLVPLITAAASEGVNYYNQKQVRNQQNSALLTAEKQQQQHQQQANAQTQQLLQKMGKSNDVAQKAKQQSALEAVLAANKDNSGYQQPGAVSSAFAGASNQAQAATNQFANQQAGELAGMAAPRLQRVAEGNDIANYNTALSHIAHQNALDQYLMKLKMQSIHGDPWLSALSAMGQGYAQGYPKSHVMVSGNTPKMDTSNWFSGSANVPPGLA